MRRFIVTGYNQRVPGETGQPPQSRWDAGGFLPRLPDRLEDLDLLLLTVLKARVVHRDGIRYAGLRYVNVDLASFIGEPVVIRYDPRDLTSIRVFHEGTFLCTAVCQELADTTISLKELQAARTRRRRELRGEITARRTLVEELLAVHQAASPPPPADGPRPRLKRYAND
jgi:putative transposase